VGGPAILRGNSRPSRQKSLAANFRFQGCCLPRATAPDFERPLRVRTSTHDPFRDGRISPSREDKRARADRSLRLRRRLESKRAPLVRPGRGQVNETLEAKAARQASFHCRLDDLRREKISDTSRAQASGEPGFDKQPSALGALSFIATTAAQQRNVRTWLRPPQSAQTTSSSPSHGERAYNPQARTSTDPCRSRTILRRHAASRSPA
jgi:hypothetical protein